VSQRLDVYFEDRRVGAIDEASIGFSFAYASSWLDDTEAFPISVSLPLSSVAASASAQRFFSNLLPEANIRTLVCRRLGISEGNDFALLEAIGGECAGALTILPYGEHPIAATSDYELLTPKVLRALAENYEALPAVDGRKRIRLSLAGAQDKLPVFMDGPRFYLPRGNSPSTHILKFPNQNFKHLPANEVLIAEIAKRVGLHTANTRWHSNGPEGLCLVERYDRILQAGGQVRRLHQEDFCQALGLASTSKYEREDGPSFQKCLELVRAQSASPLRDAQSLVHWLAFNLVVGNADAHAKNLSLLYETDTRLAPFYDLVCTRAYDRIDRRMAMDIGDEADPDRVRTPQITACADNIDVKPNWLREVTQTMALNVTEVLKDAVEASGVASSPGTERILRLIRKQARRIAREL
jgi:serine/threonine-protein kinase HipA